MGLQVRQGRVFTWCHPSRLALNAAVTLALWADKHYAQARYSQARGPVTTPTDTTALAVLA